MWSTCFIFWPAIFTVIFTFRRFLRLQQSTSCFQISSDYASLSLCQYSGNPYVFHILNMCDYFNPCFEQSNNYTYWVTCLVSFFRILIANGVNVTLTTWCTSYFRSGSLPVQRVEVKVTTSSCFNARSAWLNLPPRVQGSDCSSTFKVFWTKIRPRCLLMQTRFVWNLLDKRHLWCRIWS